MNPINLFILVLLLFSCTESGNYDLLIKNANVYDGKGANPEKVDIAIQGDSIVAIGDFSSRNAKQIIDADGKSLSPGFIDMHAHGNPAKNGDFQNFLAMGVTTMALGQDGDGPENLKEWFTIVDSLRTGVNIAVFSGHGTLRKKSGIGYSEAVSPDQLKAIGLLLEADLALGSFGLSFGLEYTPGIYAKQAELDYLAAVAGRHQALITGHIRNEDDDQIEKSIDEMISMNHFANVNISHLKVVYGKEAERAEAILNKLNQRNERIHPLTADVYPYSASYTGIGIVFPKWAKAPHDYNQVKQKRRAELLRFIKDKVTKRNGPEATLFGNGQWKGKTLKQVADESGKAFEVVLVDDIGPGGASAAYFVMNDDLQDRLTQDPNVMISSDGSPTMYHPRGYGSFAKIIRRSVFEKKLFSLAEAIRKMTSLPAQSIGIEKRGQIKVGFKADLIIFDPTKVKDVAQFDSPHQLAEGFETVIVNGQIARQDGYFNAERYGIALRKN